MNHSKESAFTVFLKKLSPKNMTKKRAIISGICIVCFLVSLLLLIKLCLIPDNEKVKEYKKPTASKTSSDSSVEAPTVDMTIDFDALKAQNPNVCAWITVEDPDSTGKSPIDYPILQSSSSLKEDFYLTHNLDNKYSFDGSIYIQRYNNNNFKDKVTIIYGHDLADGTMFTPLKKFRTTSYFNEHDTIHIYMPGKVLTYKIFSAFIYDDRHILNAFNSFTKDSSYQAFLDDCVKPQSLSKHVRKGVDVTTKDKIIVLSTCTNVDTQRYLVCAVLQDEKEIGQNKIER